jgi:small subunit ribosomal protein S20
MPILKNAKKALRVSKRKTDRNKVAKSKTKTAIDKVKKSPTMELLSGAYSAIDKAAKRNLMHANKAARLKNQLSKLVKPGKVEKKVAPKKAAKKSTPKKASTAKKKVTKKVAKK